MDIFQKVMSVRRGVVFRRKDNFFGWCFPQDREEPIYINLDFHGDTDPVITYLHECLHILFPSLSEELIRKVEKRVWVKLSARQRFLLARKMYRREWRTEI